MSDRHWLSSPTRFTCRCAERAALDALGPLLPSPQGDIPALTIVTDPCWVHVALGSPGHLRTVGSAISLGNTCLQTGGSSSVVGARLRAAHLSPDRQNIAVTVEIDDKFMEYVDSSTVTLIVDAS